MVLSDDNGVISRMKMVINLGENDENNGPEIVKLNNLKGKWYFNEAEN